MSGSDQTFQSQLSSQTLVELLQNRAIQQPNRIAYTFLTDGEDDAIALTYAELERQARVIATKLSLLCPPGERALLLYPPGLNYIAALFGCLYAGVVAIPAYPPQPNRSLERFQSILTDAQPRLALSDRATIERLETRLSQTSALAGLDWLATDALLQQGGAPANWQTTDVGNETLALLQYTSASTADPKGVLLTHHNLLHNLQRIQQQFGHTAESKGVIWLPPYHDMGLVGGILQPLYVGFPVVLFSPWLFVQSPMRWLRAISRHQATTSGGPNFAYDLCVRKFRPGRADELDLSSWQVAFNGAEPVRSETLEQFATLFAPYGFRPEALYPCYGMAEATLIITGGESQKRPVQLVVDGRSLLQNQVVEVEPHHPAAKTLVSCGTNPPDQNLQIVEPETLTPCAPATVGEIWVASPSVARGYWNRPVETLETFQQRLAKSFSRTESGAFLRTGDLGFLHNGHLFVTGRLKDLIIIRGRNHYPQDLELTAQASHAALRAGGVAFAVEQNGIERLVIVQEVERRAVPNLNAEEIFRAIVQAIAEQHELQVWAIALLKPGSLPKTSSGKVQRRACRLLFLEEKLEAIAQWQSTTEMDEAELQLPNSPVQSASANVTQSPTSPSDPRSEVDIQNWLVTNLANYLNVEPDQIDITAPFAYYGLDSSVAVSLTGELAEWLGIEDLEPILFWEYPSIEALAEHLSESKAA